MHLFLILIPVWAIFGFALLRYILTVREILLLAPLSLATGMVFHTWLLNLTVRVLPVPIGAWIALGLMLLLAALFYYYRQPSAPIRLSVSPMVALLLVAGWLAVTLIAYRAMYSYTVWDEIDHGPRATMIAQVGIPMGGYATVNSCGYYHYAVNLLEGVLFRQSGYANLKPITDMLSAIHMSLAIALCTIFLWLVGKRQALLWSAVGAIVFATASSATWLPLIHGNEQIDQRLGDSEFFTFSRNYYHITENLSQDDGNSSIGLSVERPFPLTQFTRGFRQLSYSFRYAEEQAIWMIGFLILIGWLHYDRQRWQWYHYLGIGQAVAFTALYFETATPLFALPIGFFLIYQVWATRRENWQRQIGYLALYGFPALLTMVLQGGTLTDVLNCSTIATSVAGEQTSILSANINDQFSYTLHNEVILSDWHNWLRAVIEWGIGIFFVPINLLYFAYQRQWKIVLLLSVFTLSIAVPFTLYFPFSPEDVARFANLPLWVICGMSIYPLRALTQSRYSLIRLIAPTIVVLTLLGISFSGIANIIRDIQQPKGGSAILEPLDKQAQAAWLGQLDPYEDAIFTPYYTDHPFAELAYVARPIMIFGTYGRNSGMPNNTTRPFRSERADWYTGGYPGDLQKLGFRYVYLDQATYELMPIQLQDNLANPAYYRLVEEWTSDTDFRRLYQIVGDEQIAEMGEPDMPRQLLSEALYSTYETVADETPALPDEPNVLLVEAYDLTSRQYIAQLSHFMNLNPDVSLERQRQYAALVQFLAKNPVASANTHADNWQPTFLPGELRAAGYNYLFISDDRLSALTDFQREVVLGNPAMYQLVISSVAINQAGYTLYAVMGSASEATFGLSPENFALYETYQPAFAWTPETRILNPTSGNFETRPDIWQGYGAYVEHDMPLDESALHQQFDRMKVLATMTYPTAEVTAWQQTYSPDDLIAAGFDYLLVDEGWRQTLPAEKGDYFTTRFCYLQVPGFSLNFYYQTFYLYTPNPDCAE